MLCKRCGIDEEDMEVVNTYGLHWCRECLKFVKYGSADHEDKVILYNAMHRDELKKYHKEYYQKNKEMLKAKATKWRKDNKQKHSEYRKKYYQANKDKIKATQKKYNEKNKEKIRQYQKEYLCKKKQAKEKLIEELYQKVADLQYENKMLKEKRQ